jgi:hypothetical protein
METTALPTKGSPARAAPPLAAIACAAVRAHLSVGSEHLREEEPVRRGARGVHLRKRLARCAPLEGRGRPGNASPVAPTVRAGKAGERSHAAPHWKDGEGRRAAPTMNHDDPSMLQPEERAMLPIERKNRCQIWSA